MTAFNIYKFYKQATKSLILYSMAVTLKFLKIFKKLLLSNVSVTELCKLSLPLCIFYSFNYNFVVILKIKEWSLFWFICSFCWFLKILLQVSKKFCELRIIWNITFKAHQLKFKWNSLLSCIYNIFQWVFTFSFI